MKRQPSKWEKILANHTSDKLIFKICKELIQSDFKVVGGYEYKFFSKEDIPLANM